MWDALETVFWIGTVTAAAASIALYLARREPRNVPPPDPPPSEHPEDCACRDQHTIPMWTIPNRTERQ